MTKDDFDIIIKNYDLQMNLLKELVDRAKDVTVISTLTHSEFDKLILELNKAVSTADCIQAETSHLISFKGILSASQTSTLLRRFRDFSNVRDDIKTLSGDSYKNTIKAMIKLRFNLHKMEIQTGVYKCSVLCNLKLKGDKENGPKQINVASSQQ